MRPEREAHGAGQTPASPHGTAPRWNRDAGTVSPRQSIVTRMGQDRLRGSVKRSGIARWSRHYWPRTFASLPLGTSHHRPAVRLGKPARQIMTSTARAASSSCRRGAGAGGDDEKLIAAALGVLRLSVTTTWWVSPSAEARSASNAQPSVMGWARHRFTSRWGGNEWVSAGRPQRARLLALPTAEPKLRRPLGRAERSELRAGCRAGRGGPPRGCLPSWRRSPDARSHRCPGRR